jgi:hypothetical protein
MPELRLLRCHELLWFGTVQCCLPLGHADDHAYDPAEAHDVA